MAEGTQVLKKVAFKSKTNSLQKLLDAVHRNDERECSELLSEISLRTLNRMVRLKYKGYVGYTVTPFLWAVIKGHHGIVQLMLSGNFIIDKIGTYYEQKTLHSISPLLVAVTNQDSKMMQILLDKGFSVQQGVPGQRTKEEEGSFLQYSKHIFPLNACIGKDKDIFRMMLLHADLTLEYGEEEHTCLCYTLEYFTENENSSGTSSLSYIKEVLNCGGVFCESDKIKNSFFLGQRMCWTLRMFMWGLLSRKCELGSKRYSHHIQCLRLLLSSDYSHRNSFIYNVCKHFLALIEAEGPHSEICVDAVPAEMIQVLHYTQMPSSLLHISCVAVRQLVKPVSHEKLGNFNLPNRLVKYVMLDDV